MILKRSIKFVFLGLIFGLGLFGSLDVSVAGAEDIRNFNAKYIIGPDGIVNATESITYDFGTNEKHGIYRLIPLTNEKGPDLGIKINSVKDENGASYAYTVSIQNDEVNVKIGDANRTVSGVHTYIISYDIINVIRPFSDHDEFYWNVTGNNWLANIENVSADIKLPSTITTGLQTECFTGAKNSTAKDCTISGTTFQTTRVLNAGEGLTIDVGFPHGIITLPSVMPSGFLSNKSQTSNAINIQPQWIIIFFIFVFFLIIAQIIRQFRMKLRKPKPIIPDELKNQPIVVEYGPPNNLPPIDVGTIIDMKLDPTDISATIIDLAIRGYWKIRYIQKEIPSWPDKKDFEIIKLKENDLTHPTEWEIYELFVGTRPQISFSEFKKINKKTQNLKQRLNTIQEKGEERLASDGYFDVGKYEKKKKYTTYSILLTLASFIICALANILPFWLLILLIPVGLITLIFSILIKNRLSALGIETLSKILGFREFLQLTEKDRLELLNAPELKPETFEKFLPYAMVLGVEEKWAKQFEGIYQGMPYWYEDPTGHSFSSIVLVNNLSSFNTSFNSAFHISAAGSSSGLGGGGFSGGGSGGGGGGSW